MRARPEYHERGRGGGRATGSRIADFDRAAHRGRGKGGGAQDFDASGPGSGATAGARGGGGCGGGTGRAHGPSDEPYPSRLFLYQASLGMQICRNVNAYVAFERCAGIFWPNVSILILEHSFHRLLTRHDFGADTSANGGMRNEDTRRFKFRFDITI